MSDRAHTRGRERPILFSAPMVRALLDGRKTQTRRILKPQPTGDVIHFGWQAEGGAFWTDQNFESHRLRIWAGDRLWVREAHYLTDDGDYERAVCAVDADEVREHLATVERLQASHPQVDWSRHARLRHGIHMPRWASRLTLTVTDVRVHRINDIKGRDIIAEGVRCHGCFDTGQSACRDGGCFAQRIAFENLWDGINGPYSWASNPWVAAYTFTVERRNIDATPTPDRGVTAPVSLSTDGSAA